MVHYMKRFAATAREKKRFRGAQEEGLRMRSFRISFISSFSIAFRDDSLPQSHLLLTLESIGSVYASRSF